MNIKHHAAAIIGCRMEKTCLKVEDNRRGCDHPIRQEQDIFCPQCGKQTWINLQVSIPEYDEVKGTLCGFVVFQSSIDNTIVVANSFVMTGSDNSYQCDMLDISNIQDIDWHELKSALKQCKLWRKEQFGIHVVLWYS